MAAAALSRGLAKPRQGVAPELAGNATQEARALSPGLLLQAGLGRFAARPLGLPYWFLCLGRSHQD